MNGRLALLGHGKKGNNTAATEASPKAIIAEVHNRSLPCRNTAFQPAWNKAVDRTTAAIHALTMPIHFLVTLDGCLSHRQTCSATLNQLPPSMPLPWSGARYFPSTEKANKTLPGVAPRNA